MKGRMDVLNHRKRVTAENRSRMFHSESVSRDVMKIQPDDELDKENCGNDYLTDLTLNDSRENESMSNDESSENCKDEVFATVVMEDDDEEIENPDLPVFSVAVKEENRNIRDSSRESGPLRGRVEIKYEDDIEEEEYDSDDESIDHYEMNNVNDMSDEVTPLNFVNANGRISSKISPAGVAYRSCFNTDYFDSNMTNFQIGNQMERSDSLESDMNEDLEKSSDSILLSIVYATINVPFSQVSKFLTAYNLSKGQLSVIRKVRRQVKNRLYAQNCRKRRVAHIKNLANELQQIKVEKEKLCNVRDDLKTKKVEMENRYNQLYTYVINTLADEHRNEEFDFSDSDSNMNDSSEETKLLKRKLTNECEELDTKKQKMEQKYEELYKHVFRVIKSRHQNNGLTRNAMDGGLDFQLCHMYIVNELAMLNKYWTKNNLQKTNEQMDFESSISIDGSRTSENKLNDFVDYESSLSVADSRGDESKMNDFVDYESSVDYSIQQSVVAHYHDSEKEQSDSNEVVILGDDNDKHDNHDNSAKEEQKLDGRKNYPEPNSSSQNNHTDENGKVDDEILITCSGEEDDEDEEDDDDDLDQDIHEYMVELNKQKETLKSEKSTVHERYEALYEHVFKALKISETEFLKNLLDYCIGLMKPCAVQPSVPKSEPGRSTIKLEGS